MSDLKKVDQLLQALIKETPILNNGYKIVESYAINIDKTVDLKKFRDRLSFSYKQFEDWLDTLFEEEKVQDGIVAFNFGPFESEDGVQLYITGSKEWEIDDEDWASNNDYFPENRYPNITLFKELYSYWEDNFNLALFLAVSSTIIFANTYLISKPTKFPSEVIIATGFDDGDIYNFLKKIDDKITSLFN